MNKQTGFTLIELLVTLSIIGLLASLTVPSVSSWLVSRQFAAERDALASELALLPLKASVTGQQVIIDDSSQIAPLESEVIVTQPITVLSNGFCMGGELQLMQDKTQQRFAVKPPFCEISRVP